MFYFETPCEFIFQEVQKWNMDLQYVNPFKANIPLLYYYTPWKLQKTKTFSVVFQGV